MGVGYALVLMDRFYPQNLQNFQRLSNSLRSDSDRLLLKILQILGRDRIGQAHNRNPLAISQGYFNVFGNASWSRFLI